MNIDRALRIILKRVIVFPVVLVCMCLTGGAPKARALTCSNATLEGGYGFFVHAMILPAGTPRAILGTLNFDGRGHFTSTLAFNDNGMVIPATDSGTYMIAADCTGKIFTNAGTRTIEIVIVDAGREFYQLRTDPPNILFLFNVAKKQLPGDSHDH